MLACYATLTETEIKTLVVEDKWLATIREAIEGEMQRLTQQLAGRAKELEERYARPLPESGTGGGSVRCQGRRALEADGIVVMREVLVPLFSTSGARF